MLLILSIFFATQPLYLEGISCKAWEYPVHQECCPMCSQGQRVLKHCTVDSSTTCLPCTEGTFTEHPNGLEACITCQQCDPGANLNVKEQCTYTKNTVCACRAGYFCIHPNDYDCDVCQKHTVSPPGHRVTQLGTETSNTEYVPCPSGTFAATEMSSSCKPWTNCSQLDSEEVCAGSDTSDVVCEPRSSSMGIIISAIIGIFVAICIAVFVVWILKKRKKATRKAAAREQGGPNGEYFPVQECGPNMVMPMQETAQNHGEPTYKAV